MGLIPDVDLSPVERAAKTIAPVLERLTAALEEHNYIEREKLGMNIDPETGEHRDAKSKG